MILPIAIYGNPILKRMAEEIDEDYPELETLIDDMWETLYSTEGVGLAAPQVNVSIRLFVIDASNIKEGYKKVFINPIIEEFIGDDIEMREGCLSIPELNEIVKRKQGIKISYFDENWDYIEETHGDTDDVESLKLSRIIQHEYDHIEGQFYLNKLSSLKRQLLKGKLDKIRRGEYMTEYDTIRIKK